MLLGGEKLKKILSIILCGIVILSMKPVYAERIYISRLDDTNRHMAQSSTGIYSDTNCGPVSIGMILDYLEYPYKSISWLRYQIRDYGGWVYTDEIEEYLLEQCIPYNISLINREEDIINKLNNGAMMMVCLDISYISTSYDSYVGRQYKNGTGHYVVISGYYKNDTQCYFEVLDPSNKGVKYYKSNELISSITTWWPWAFSFNKVNTK